MSIKIYKICSVENCEEISVSLGFCKKHYVSYKTYGDPTKAKSMNIPKKYCIIENCDEIRHGYGYCRKHYGRFKRHGDPNYVEKVMYVYEGCFVNGCEGKHHSGGHCIIHYYQIRRSGRITSLEPKFRKLRKNGEGNITSNGYKHITVGNELVYEHRYIMEQHIGKKLSRNEVIHHINGSKLDNRIENLEVMNRIEHLKMHFKKSTRFCELDNCSNKHFAYGLCSKHMTRCYRYSKRNGLELNYSINKMKLKEFLK